MGGNLQRRKLIEHTMFLYNIEVVRRFNAFEWLGYFLSLTAYDEEVATKFTRTFFEVEASVWGLTIVAIEECITKVTGLPMVGEHYPSTHDTRSMRTQFTRPNDPELDVTKKRCKRLSFPPPYHELMMHIIRYFTCEGRFLYLHAHHFKLLSCVRHNLAMNIPNFLYNMLCISAEETQKGKENSVTHHDLIKLLIERSLRDVSRLTLDEFV